MKLDVILSYLTIGFSAASIVLICAMSFRVWRSQRRLIKRIDEYNTTLEKATAHLRANPSAWLAAMQMLDDKRRMH